MSLNLLKISIGYRILITISIIWLLICFIDSDCYFDDISFWRHGVLPITIVWGLVWIINEKLAALFSKKTSTISENNKKSDTLSPKKTSAISENNKKSDSLSSKKTTIISEDNPLIIGKLKVYPSEFEYKNVRYNFLDIEHIKWYWLSQTINFILNSQSARLNLYIRGREKPITIKSSSMMFIPPRIVEAYKFISQQTFENRLAFYMNQIEEMGYFTYDNSNIYLDGQVISYGKIFSLSKANIETFHITIKQSGIFGPRAKIRLDLDRDVILVLIKFIIQNKFIA